jgi:hypothetical protein
MGGRRARKGEESDESDFESEAAEEEEEMKVERPPIEADGIVDGEINVTVEPESEWVRRSTRSKRSVKKDASGKEEGDLGFEEEEVAAPQRGRGGKRGKGTGQGKAASKKPMTRKKKKSEDDENDDVLSSDDAFEDDDDDEDDDEEDDDEEVFMEEEEEEGEEKDKCSKKKGKKKGGVASGKKKKTPRTGKATKVVPSKKSSGKGKGSVSDAGGSGARGSVPESEGIDCCAPLHHVTCPFIHTKHSLHFSDVCLILCIRLNSKFDHFGVYQECKKQFHC